MSLGIIDKEAAMPLYHQLYVTLRDQIVAGIYGPGASLPSERELMQQFEVARVTVKRAVAELEHDGYVVRKQGSGTYVRENPLCSPIGTSMQAVIDNVVAIGAATEGHIIEMVNVAPSASVRVALNLQGSAKVQRSVHTRSRDGEPIGLFTTCVPLDIGRKISAKNIEAKPMLLLLEALGVRPAWASQTIGVELADAYAAKLLNIARGDPLVRLQRVVYDEKDRAVEHLLALYRGDRYEYKTVLRRDSAWGLG